MLPAAKTYGGSTEARMLRETVRPGIGKRLSTAAAYRAASAQPLRGQAATATSKKARRRGQHSGPPPTATGGICRLALERARKAHLNVAPLLQRANLTERQVTDDRVRVPVRSQ